MKHEAFGCLVVHARIDCPYLATHLPSRLQSPSPREPNASAWSIAITCLSLPSGQEQDAPLRGPHPTRRISGVTLGFAQRCLPQPGEHTRCRSLMRCPASKDGDRHQVSPRSAARSRTDDGCKVILQPPEAIRVCPKLEADHDVHDVDTRRGLCIRHRYCRLL